MVKMISLITDFGHKDAYAASMKGVIYTINPHAKIIDLTHDIDPQDISSAAWVLYSCYQYFPEKTIFVCVVDPGVGSSRENILVDTGKYYFVGPDNGFISEIFCYNKDIKVYKLDNSQYWLNNISNTFHGRDIFAPVAAHLSLDNCTPESFGTLIPTEKLVILDYYQPEISHNTIRGTVVHIDHFGNLITNISSEFIIDKALKISIAGKIIDRLSLTYSEVDAGDLIAIIGSHNNLEISVNYGNAATLLDADRGSEIIIDFLDD